MKLILTSLISLRLFQLILSSNSLMLFDFTSLVLIKPLRPD